jgi:hypothetical protein
MMMLAFPDFRKRCVSIVALIVLPVLFVMVPSTILAVQGSCNVNVAVSPASNSVPIGGTVVFTVSIKSNCGTDHIGWGPQVVSPTPVVKCDKQGVCTSNGPVFHQGSYKVVGSGTQQFTASATADTLMTTWTIRVVASDVTHCCSSASATFTLTVNNFSVTANPTSIDVGAGQTATSTITTSAQNGFTGTIYFSVNQPSYVCNLQPGPVTLTATNNSVNSILTCNFPTGTFTVTVTGTPYNGVPSRTATITVTVK